MEVNKIIINRRSSVAFSERPVEKEVLQSLFEAARWAPSSYNEQPWRFLYGEKGSEGYEKIFDALLPGNQVWAGRAPVLMIGIASKYLQRNGKPNKYAFYDLGQAVSNISAQATALGLKMHQMGGFDPEKVIKDFEVSEDFEPAVAIALGYPGNLEDLDENLQRRELGTRSRKSLNEIVFKENWSEEPVANNY